MNPRPYRLGQRQKASELTRARILSVLRNFRDSKAAVETYRDGGMCSFACLEAPVSKASQRFPISLRKSQHSLTDF